MSGTQHRPPLASYRDAVTELIGAGEPFGDVEDAIDEVAELTQDQKAALWLFAFSLRDPLSSSWTRAPTWPASSSEGDGAMTEQARQRELGDAIAAALERARGAPRGIGARRRRCGAGWGDGGSRPPAGVRRERLPVAQRNPSFVTRVARLRSPS